MYGLYIKGGVGGGLVPGSYIYVAILHKRQHTTVRVYTIVVSSGKNGYTAQGGEGKCREGRLGVLFTSHILHTTVHNSTQRNRQYTAAWVSSGKHGAVSPAPKRSCHQQPWDHHPAAHHRDLLPVDLGDTFVCHGLLHGTRSNDVQ
jgi:hypothetical protein